MKNTIFFSADTEESKDFFKKSFPDAIYLGGEVQDYKTDEIEEREDIEIASCFTASTFNKENIDKFPNLKLIATRSTGFNHIDLDYCKEKGIEVANVPVYGANTVAEFAFALIIALSRKAFYSYEMVKKDMNFSRRGTAEIKGFDLKGKTIGVLGAGNIGKHTIAIAAGFQMNIVAFDLHPDDELTQKYGVVWKETVNDVITSSDIISIHVPLNKYTHHLIGREQKPLFKKGSILVNTSRGEVLDTVVLKELLDEGVLSAAGLDVLEYEGSLGKEEVVDAQDQERAEKVVSINRDLVKMKNVIVTPHNAFNTVDAIGRIWETTEENIINFQEGKGFNSVK